MIKDLLKEYKIKHWVKNLIIFLPLFFGKELFNIHLLIETFIGFISFSLIASAIYLMNDLCDIEKDKKHPIKRNRPIASERISKRTAIINIIIFLIISPLLIINTKSAIIAVACLFVYFLINILYSVFKLKDKPIIDVTIIAIGFLLRLLFGSSITNIQISEYLYLIMFSISYYIAFNKRINEKTNNKENGTRTSLNKYPNKYLETMNNIFLTLTITFYSLWATSVASNNIMLITVPIFIVIIIYYAYIVMTSNIEDPVEILYKNQWLDILLGVYGVILIVIIYLT